MILTIDEIRLTPWGNCRAGLTSGCFDLLHFHHLHYLERCRAKCDFLVVGVDSDDLLRQNKAKDPVIPEYQRAAMVAALRCVGAVFILRGIDQFSDLLRGENLQGPWFDKIFKNSPEIYGKPIVGLDPDDRRLFIIPDVHDVNSTTGIVEKIRSYPTPDEQKDRLIRGAFSGDELRVPIVADYSSLLRNLGKHLITMKDGEHLILPVKERPHVSEALKVVRKATDKRYNMTVRHRKHPGCVVVKCYTQPDGPRRRK